MEPPGTPNLKKSRKVGTKKNIEKQHLVFPLQLRKWQNGDFFYPSGMAGKKKLSKYFKDEVIQVLSGAIQTHYGDKLRIKYARADVKPRYEKGPIDAMKMEMQLGRYGQFQLELPTVIPQVWHSRWR